MEAVALSIFAAGVALITGAAAFTLGAGYGEAVLYAGIGLIVGEFAALVMLTRRP